MMDNIIEYLNQPLPTSVLLIVGYNLLNYKVKRLIKKQDEMNQKCDSRLKWCIDHFNNPKRKGGDDNV